MTAPSWELKLTNALVRDLVPFEEEPGGVMVHLASLGCTMVFRDAEGEVVEEGTNDDAFFFPVHVPLPEGIDGSMVMYDLERWFRDQSPVNVSIERSGDLPAESPYSRIILDDPSAHWSVALAS